MLPGGLSQQPAPQSRSLAAPDLGPGPRHLGALPGQFMDIISLFKPHADFTMPRVGGR